MFIAHAPNKLESTWLDEVKAVLDIWRSYSVTLEEFRDVVLVHGVAHARAHGGIAWIVDSSQATGVFTSEILAFIDAEIFPAFKAVGIRYFLTINSTVSPVTRMSVNAYIAKVVQNGLIHVACDTVDEAVAWLKTHAETLDCSPA